MIVYGPLKQTAPVNSGETRAVIEFAGTHPLDAGCVGIVITHKAESYTPRDGQEPYRWPAEWSATYYTRAGVDPTGIYSGPDLAAMYDAIARCPQFH